MTGTSIAAAVKVAGPTVRATKGIVDFLRARRSVSKASSRARSVLQFYPDEGNVAYRLSQWHPMYGEIRYHPDDLAAFEAIADPAIAQALSSDWLVEDRRCAAALHDDIVSIGSPESEPLARLFHGYQRRGQGNSGGMQFIGGAVELPFRWLEDPSRVTADCVRDVPGRGPVRRPNWPLVDARGAVEQLKYPHVGNDGYLQSDYLVVTVLPNFLTQLGLQMGKRFVNIAGLHGSGTRAIGLALKDQTFIKAVTELDTGRRCAFQILVRVELDKSTRRLPRDVSVEAAESLQVDDWERPRKLLAERFSQWSLEDSGRNLLP